MRPIYRFIIYCCTLSRECVLRNFCHRLANMSFLVNIGKACRFSYTEPCLHATRIWRKWLKWRRKKKEENSHPHAFCHGIQDKMNVLHFTHAFHTRLSYAHYWDTIRRIFHARVVVLLCDFRMKGFFCMWTFQYLFVFFLCAICIFFCNSKCICWIFQLWKL